MHFFNITLNDCSELSGLMFTVNILFQIITPLYLMPALDQLEKADGTCRWLAVLVPDHVYDNCTWKSHQKLLDKFCEILYT